VLRKNDKQEMQAEPRGAVESSRIGLITLDVKRIINRAFPMIKSFRGKKTYAVYNGKRVKEFHAIVAQAERRLQILDNATSLQDLSGLPSNRFEALRGDRFGQYSIRINDQWRLCFTWADGHAHDVEIVDYH
jgi:proteic killer suppression protein